MAVNQKSKFPFETTFGPIYHGGEEVECFCCSTLGESRHR